MSKSWFALLSAAALSTLAFAGLGQSSRAQARYEPLEPTVAGRAKAIFEQHCYACHGQNGVANKNVFVLDRDRLVRSGVVVPGDPKSLLLKVVEAGVMPYKGEKLSEPEIQDIRDWIAQRAPDWAPEKPPVRAAFLTEKGIVELLTKDLENANVRDRPYLRYFSLAHVYNAGAPAAELEKYRAALSKLVNSLSWHPKITGPEPIDADQTLLRIDLRNYRWTPDTWNTIVSRYPDTIIIPEAYRISELSAAPVPYLRADWFATHASVPPLYHQILGLPQTARELETMLGVDVTRALEQEKDVLRGGVRNSGVSLHNRVLERHVTANGAYWKSYDFRSDQGNQSVFRDPLRLNPAGSEYIFNLPNGMQAYFISNGAGARLDAAPEEIVTDRNHPDEPTVITGLTCMSCHSGGINRFREEVRSVVQTQPDAAFDREKVLALYPQQAVLDQYFTEDAERFRLAVEASGGQVSTDFRTETVNALARRFKADLSIAQAAAEMGLETSDFQSRVGKSARLKALGLGQLLVLDGGVKRNAWDALFSYLVQELGVGDYGRLLHPRVRPLKGTTGQPAPALSGGAVEPVLNPDNLHWYQAVTVPGGIGWNDAKAAAEQMSLQRTPGHLVTITSAEEQKFITGKFPTAVQGSYWMGGFQPPGSAEPRGGWAWVTSEPWDYTNWNRAEPNNGLGQGGEDMLQLTTDGTWNDIRPITKVPGFIVEFSPSVTDDHYIITNLGRLGSGPASAYSTNSSGQTAGASRAASGYERAFRTAANRAIRSAIDEIKTLGGSTNSAVAINDRGQVAGSSRIAGDKAWHAFLMIGDKPPLDLSTLGGSHSFAAALNQLGQVVGYSDTLQGTQHAFRTAPKQPINVKTDDLGTLGGAESRATGINAGGQVVGSASTVGGRVHAFRTGLNKAINPQTDSLGTLGGSTSAAWAINDHGDVVGASNILGDAASNAFIFSGGGPMQDLGGLAGYNACTARSINNARQIVGYCENLRSFSSINSGATTPAAFLYENGVMRNLNNLIPANSGWTLQRAFSINDAGQIVGTGQFNGVVYAFLLTPR